MVSPQVAPDHLDLDLEQLLKSRQAPSWASCQASEQFLEKPRQPPSTPTPSHAMTAHGPRFYAPCLNLYFVSLVEMVSSGSIYAVLTVHHLSPHPPKLLVLGRLREVLKHHQRPCRQSKTDPTQVPTNCPSMRYWFLSVHMMCHYILHLYLGITLFCRLALL